jgi:hypothetical protein
VPLSETELDALVKDGENGGRIAPCEALVDMPDCFEMIHFFTPTVAGE